MPTPTSTTLFPYTTLFRSGLGNDQAVKRVMVMQGQIVDAKTVVLSYRQGQNALSGHSFAHIGPGSLRQLKLSQLCQDRKSTRLNSSHRCISYAVFCLKKKR